MEWLCQMLPLSVAMARVLVPISIAKSGSRVVPRVKVLLARTNPLIGV